MHPDDLSTATGPGSPAASTATEAASAASLVARFGPGLVDEMQSLLNADLAEQAAALAAQNTALAAEVRCDTAEWRYQYAHSLGFP